MNIFTKKQYLALWVMICLMIGLWIRTPSTQTQQVLWYILLGNMIVFGLLRIVGIWFFHRRYAYLKALILWLRQAHDGLHDYSYIQSVVLLPTLTDRSHHTYLADIDTQSESLVLTIIYDNQEYDFKLAERHKDHAHHVAAMIITMMRHGIPYEFLYEHLRRNQNL